MTKTDLQALVAHLPAPPVGVWRETDYAEHHRHDLDGQPVLRFEFSEDDDLFECVWLVVDTTPAADDGAADRAYAIGLDHALEATQ